MCVQVYLKALIKIIIIQLKSVPNLTYVGPMWQRYRVEVRTIGCNVPPIVHNLL